MSTSTDSIDSKRESTNTSEEETISLVSTDDESQTNELVPSTAVSAEQSVSKSGSSEGDIAHSQEEDLQFPTQASDEPMKSRAEVSGNGSNIIVGAVVPEAAAEPPALESTASHAEIMDVTESSPRRQKGVEEPEVVFLVEGQSNGVENDPLNASMVNQEEKGPEGVPSSDSMASAIHPVLSSESLQSSSDNQETEGPNRVSDIEHSAEIERLQARLKELEQRFSGMTPNPVLLPTCTHYCLRRLHLL